jgi:hypothetical protein
LYTTGLEPLNNPPSARLSTVTDIVMLALPLPGDSTTREAVWLPNVSAEVCAAMVSPEDAPFLATPWWRDTWSQGAVLVIRHERRPDPTLPIANGDITEALGGVTVKRKLVPDTTVTGLPSRSLLLTVIGVTSML